MTTVVPPPARQPGSLPFPGERPGTVNQAMPFDHIVVIMMENHSFDNLLGGLSKTRSDVKGLTFDPNTGEATNSVPGAVHTPARVTSFPLTNTAQGKDVSQNWKETHLQINGGAMDGFVRAAGGLQPMGYYTRAVLPFAYSLASTFTLANHWHCSMPGPTYPNRRFLLAGTAFGGTTTTPETLLDSPPPHGTIFDRLSDNNINWCNYFTDVPLTAVIPSIAVQHTRHLAQLDKFFHDCQAGSLPAVSFVDPPIGIASEVAAAMASLPGPAKDLLKIIGADFSGTIPAATEEDPQDLYYGESWAHKAVEAVLQSPKWNRTLLIYTYDEHGGYYDHIPPPRAIPPDNIPPSLQPGDPPGGYDLYGPRVPAIVVSPYSKPGGVSNKLYDHTSVLATIEAKWNLPALTLRDANANHVMDFLDTSTPALLSPPAIAAPVKPPGL